MASILSLMKSVLRPGRGPSPGAVAMLGVRGADAVLFLGAGRPELAAAVGILTTLNGQTTVADPAASAADRVTRAAEAAGALVGFVATPLSRLALDSQSCDVVVLPAGLAALGADAPSVLAEAIRLLRPGGRIVLCEPAPRQGLFRLAQASPQLAPASVVPRLTAAGLRGARHLGTLDDTAFFEAARPR